MRMSQISCKKTTLLFSVKDSINVVPNKVFSILFPISCVSTVFIFKTTVVQIVPQFFH